MFGEFRRKVKKSQEQIGDFAVRNEKKQEMIQTLNTLDFNNLHAVMDWVVDYCNCTDYSDLVDREDNKKILDIFHTHGFEPTTDESIVADVENKEEWARQIIGEALAMIKTEGSLHYTILTAGKQWMEKFDREDTAAGREDDAKRREQWIEDTTEGVLRHMENKKP